MDQQEFQTFIAGAQNAGVLFFYAGSFTPAVVTTAGDALRQRLDEAGASSGVKRKLFSTFVEMAQNILHYAAPGAGTAHGSGAADEGLKQGAIAVGRGGPGDALARAADARSGGEFWIVCSNPVDPAYVPRITEKLEAVRAMSLDDIKKSYKAQLHNSAHSADDHVSKGAGLGLLTMARDSVVPLEYTFAPGEQSGQAAQFYMRAVI